MRIKSILISDDRVASGGLNHVATGLSQDESVRCADLWPVHPRRRYLSWDTAFRAVATVSTRSSWTHNDE
jgi:hypothetical protein